MEITFLVVRERKDKERQSCPGLNGEETFTKLTIFLLTFYFFSGTKRNTATSNKCIIFIRGDYQRGMNQLTYG